MSFTLSYILPLISLYSLPLSISLLSPFELFLLSLLIPISLCFLSLRRAKRDRERKQRGREIRRGGENREREEWSRREQREIKGRGIRRRLERERDEGKRERLLVPGDGAPPLNDDAGENHYDRILPEVVFLLFLWIGERYIFFFLLLLGSDEETTARLQRWRRASEFGWIFFAIDRESMEGLKKVDLHLNVG